MTARCWFGVLLRMAAVLSLFYATQYLIYFVDVRIGWASEGMKIESCLLLQQVMEQLV